MRRQCPRRLQSIREVDHSRLLHQRPGAEAQAQAPPQLPLHMSAERRPQLLAGLALGSDEVCSGLRVCILEAGKPERILDRIRLVDLVKELWPDSNTDAYCRSLRSLNDSSRQDFMLRATRKGIWLRTDFARAIVEPSRVIFLDNGNPTFSMFFEEFIQRTKRSYESEDSFNCWVVECVICAAVTLHSLRLQMVKPVVESILDGTRRDAFNSILKLYPLKMALTSFIDQLRPLGTGLRRALHMEGDGEADHDTTTSRHNSFTSEEQELRALRLSRFNQEGAAPSEFHTHGSALCPYLEEALYNWSRNAEDIMLDAISLCGKIEDTMRFLEASMSCTRNQLLVFELWTMVATVAIGMGALISGVFGMNLNNYGFDSAPGQFYSATAAIFVLMLAVVLISMTTIIRSQNHYRKHSQEFGNNRFFQHIESDEYVLSLSSSLPNGACAKLDRLLAELREPPLQESGEVSLTTTASCSRRRWASRSDPGRTPLEVGPRGANSI
mmetsp:Transcript_4274/g.9757  ORF Transcript_4274/g.9757 Transcript_4274/m.9757 type:complete len:498 (-) Transcript_4274:42-1535(-)